MFRFYLKSLTNHNPNYCTFTIFRFIETKSASIKPNLTHKLPRTVSYLVDSCGLSLKSAISVSRLVNIKNFKKSDSVLELLRSHGFSPEDISTLISRHPRVIVGGSVKKLIPKLEFFESKGVARPELPGLVNSCAALFNRSLENSIVPAFNFIECYVDVNENPVRTLKMVNGILVKNLEQSTLPQVQILHDYEVSRSMIGKLLKQQIRAFNLGTDLFREIVQSVKEMGFDPQNVKFVMAVRSIVGLTKPKWERKKEAFISLGWTKNEFDVAFKLQPMFMLISEKKMREMMEFLVKKAGVTPSDVARHPKVFMTSLEKRVIPRWFVLQILMSKGMLEKNSNVIWKILFTKDDFERLYVTKFKDKVPEVVQAYENQIPSKGSSKAGKDEQNL